MKSASPRALERGPMPGSTPEPKARSPRAVTRCSRGSCCNRCTQRVPGVGPFAEITSAVVLPVRLPLMEVVNGFLPARQPHHRAGACGKARLDLFCHPAPDVIRQPAPDRASRHVQLVAGELVHDHRDGHAPAAPAVHELPHSLAGIRVPGGGHGLLRRPVTGSDYGSPNGDSGKAPGQVRKAPGHARDVITRGTNSHNWSPRARRLPLALPVPYGGRSTYAISALSRSSTAARTYSAVGRGSSTSTARGRILLYRSNP
jgi:hypothetical protein